MSKMLSVSKIVIIIWITLKLWETDLQLYVENIVHKYWQIIEYKRNKLMNRVLKELYHKIGMKISDFLFIYISISDTLWLYQKFVISVNITH